MTYSCPDCGKALTGSVRELELEEGESAQTLEDGRVVITTAICSNGCNDEPDEENQPKRKKRKAPQASGELCSKTDDCNRPDGHTGRCNHHGKVAEE